ncbi:MAG TPA: universal stress protein [Steroidobacteraceae bacterium]|nr:universal stress protein [Steroidobacteraceae bacterium]
MALYRDILLAVDLTTDSEWIGQRAHALAAAFDAQLNIIHVLEPPPSVAPIPPEPVGPELVTEMTEMIEGAQERMGALARKLGVPENRSRVVVGSIKTEIVRAAAERGVDLIVIGYHEHHGLALLIKPTEGAVVQRAPCDVLAVHLTTSRGRP